MGRYLDDGDDLGLAWELWADGRAWRLDRGVHFSRGPQVVEEAAANAAARLGKAVRTLKESHGRRTSVWVQFADHQIGPGDPCRCGSEDLRRVNQYYAVCASCQATLIIVKPKRKPTSRRSAGSPNSGELVSDRATAPPRTTRADARAAKTAARSGREQAKAKREMEPSARHEAARQRDAPAGKAKEQRGVREAQPRADRAAEAAAKRAEAAEQRKGIQEAKRLERERLHAERQARRETAAATRAEQKEAERSRREALAVARQAERAAAGRAAAERKRQISDTKSRQWREASNKLSAYTEVRLFPWDASPTRERFYGYGRRKGQLMLLVVIFRLEDGARLPDPDELGSPLHLVRSIPVEPFDGAIDLAALERLGYGVDPLARAGGPAAKRARAQS